MKTPITLFQLQTLFFDKLSQIYEQREISALFFTLCSEVLGIPKHRVLIDKNLEIPFEKQLLFLQKLERLISGEPIQYILGYANFRNYRFCVNRSVLIPRPETEELVTHILSEKITEPSILDIGTGTGCIAIVLAIEYPNAKVTAVDISPEAIETARINANQYSVPVQFEVCDIFTRNFHKNQFQIIVSNPPYVAESEKEFMHNNVLGFEPHSALFVPDSNSLVFYERISEIAAYCLSVNGVVWVEINHQFATETSLVFKKNFQNVQIIPDIFSKNRFIRASNH
ncbi:MAG TPA: peptide chain release factor N(5)-glutamine methyltransferase [Salinivirgaceae bacterium]|nr:peptide chain release factor N(5)-glutamine methyltransferase [Salinivirgaceae bacterium]